MGEPRTITSAQTTTTNEPSPILAVLHHRIRALEEAKPLPLWQAVALSTVLIAAFAGTLLSGQGMVIAIPLGGIVASLSSMMMIRHAYA